jgi:hypothetical protein
MYCGKVNILESQAVWKPDGESRRNWDINWWYMCSVRYCNSRHIEHGARARLFRVTLMIESESTWKWEKTTGDQCDKLVFRMHESVTLHSGIFFQFLRKEYEIKTTAKGNSQKSSWNFLTAFLVSACFTCIHWVSRIWQTVWLCCAV